jgi:hypothetical protein
MMMKSFSTFLQVCLLILCMGVMQVSAQQNWYVGPGGLNLNGYGLSTATPFATVTYAATRLQPGDTLQIMGGTYQNVTFGDGNRWKIEQTVRINNLHGAPGQWITIKPYDQQPVRFKGDGDFIFQVRNSSYLVIEDLEIIGEVDQIPLDSAVAYQFAYRLPNDPTTYYRVPPGTPPAVVATMTFTPLSGTVFRPSYFSTIGLILQDCHHVLVQHNQVHHLPGTGLRAQGSDYIDVIGNEVHNNSRRSSVGNHGLVFHSMASIDTSHAVKVRIARNHVHHNYNEVYSWSEQKTFITPHIDEGKGISMQKNTFANGWHYGKIRIENNLCTFNGFSGVHANEGVRQEFIHNTCYYNSYSMGVGNFIGISTQTCDSMAIHNNISVADPLVAGHALSAANSTFLDISNNLLFGGTIDATAQSVATGTVFADPLFVQPATGDFHLLAGSPAIGAASVSWAPATDYDGLARDAAPDRGAFEYMAPLYTEQPWLSASREADGHVALSWQCIPSSLPFLLERAEAGATWQTVGIQELGGHLVIGNGTGLDRLAPVTACRYRLRGQGADGNWLVSNTVEVAALAGQVRLRAFPNPGTGRIEVNGVPEDADLRLYDLSGRDLSHLITCIRVRTGVLRVDASAMPVGTYLLRVGAVTCPWVKQN